MRHPLVTTGAAAVAVALLLAACQPIEAESRSTSRGDRDRGGTTKSVTKVYVVKRGDTLHSIAKSECGSGAAVESLVEVNVGREQPDGRIMKDPDLLHPGWTIVLSCQTVRD